MLLSQSVLEAHPAADPCAEEEEVAASVVVVVDVVDRGEAAASAVVAVAEVAAASEAAAALEVAVAQEEAAPLAAEEVALSEAVEEEHREVVDVAATRLVTKRHGRTGIGVMAFGADHGRPGQVSLCTALLYRQGADLGILQSTLACIV